MTWPERSLAQQRPEPSFLLGPHETFHAHKCWAALRFVSLALPPGWSKHFGGGWPYCPGDSLATKALLKFPHPWNKTGTRTFMKEQRLLCVAAATETLAAVAETATPQLAYSGNKDVPFSVNLSLPLSSLTKGCRSGVWVGV